MLKLSLKGLWAHKRRLAGTFSAVLLGVAFLAGALVLSDTLRASIDGFFTDSNKGTDVVVRNATLVTDNAGAQRGPVDGSLVDRVRAVDGVAVAEPVVDGFGQPVGRDGQAVTGNGPRTAGNWVADPELNPYRIAEGRPPRTDDEVVINRGAAKDGDLHVGDRTTVLTPEPVAVTVVGIATFGSADAYGGTSFTAFTLAGAERHVARQPGKVTRIAVRGVPGVPQDELVRRVRAVLPRGVEAIGGARLTEENLAQVDKQFLGLFRTFLTLFAGIALLVATFSIYNTFSIIAAQRARESALLRAVGVSRGQVLASVVTEALLVGLAASAAGLAGGLGIAKLLQGAFAGLGFDLPATGLVLHASTVAVSVPTGVAVTLLAGVVPAVRASRVPPLPALRSGAADRPGASATRAVVGTALTAVGTGLALSAAGGGSGAVPRAGAGAVVVLLGAVTLGPSVARVASAAIGAPLARLRGVTGALARRNAMRSPRRTAGAATALMVGVGVVALLTVVAASLGASIEQRASRSFGGDLAISASGRELAGLSPRLATEVGKLPEVRAAAGLGAGGALVGGARRQLSVADPAPLDRALRLGTVAGSVAGLGDRQLAVSAKAARDRRWRLGSAVPVTFADGTTATFRIGAVYDAVDVAGDYLLPRRAWRPHAPQDGDTTVFVKLADGVGVPAGKAAVERVARAYGGPTVRDRRDWIDARSQSVRQLLSLVYVMLALAIVIALMGIANTLSLSVHERARELGLLRAVGQTRAQLRSMIRWESVIVALFGTVGGLGLGVFLGWALVRAASESIGTFSASPAQLAVVFLVGAAAGVLAGLRPARRAARRNVLEAIAAE